MDFLLALAAYLIGSVTFGRVAGLLKGFNMADRDTPGASGTFRQLGAGWGLAVAAADILKGVLVAYLSQSAQAPWAMPLMGAALVAGHNWPLYFGFRGGGGIAPTLGFFGLLYPAVTLAAIAVGLAVIALYWQLYWKARRRGWYPIPVGALAGYLYALAAFWPTGLGFWAFLLVSVVVALQGLRLARRL